MEDKRLDQIIEFCTEIDKEKLIGRQTWLADASRKENDAEHAWHMAVMAILLQEYANEEIDLLKTISMLLIHDLVEIYAGDTYCYDEEGKASQQEREEQAALKLFAMLPADLEKKMHDLFDEFEKRETPEAKFACTLDHFQPVMLNKANGGISWKEHDVRLSQILKRNSLTELGSKQLWDYSLHNFIKPFTGTEIVQDVPFPEEKINGK